MKFTPYYYLLITSFCLLASCARGPEGIYGEDDEGLPPDYTQSEYWAALPWQEDNADKAPRGQRDLQAESSVDVFYLHPTMYFGKKSYDKWNAPLDEAAVNEDVDNTTLLYQASAFNAAGRVFAPRYRQAHIKAYRHEDQNSAKQAFDLAYADVKAAFTYYIDHHNGGRPFIIASHSQGTTHSQRLIAEMIDGTHLESRLVVGYLVGIPVDMAQYSSIKPCLTAEQTGCITSWRTFKKGTKPDFLAMEDDYDVLITNPLTWTDNTAYVSKMKNHGSVLLDFEEIPKPALVGTQIHKSILWSDKPKFKGSWLLLSKNYHRGDINLFWMNIRENAKLRVQSYYRAQ